MNESLAHIWETESRHPTSEGVVSYQRCRCGARRIVLIAPDVPIHLAEVLAKAG